MSADATPVIRLEAQLGVFTQLTTAEGLLIEVHPDGGSVGVFRNRNAFESGENPLVGVILENGQAAALLYPQAAGDSNPIEHRR